MAARSCFQKSNRAEETAKNAIRHMATIITKNAYENRGIWRAYLPHALYILDNRNAVDSFDALGFCYCVGSCLHLDGRINGAMRCFRCCTQWARNTLPKDHPDRLSSEHILGKAYHIDGIPLHAVALLEQIIKVESTLPEDNPARFTMQRSLAQAQY